MKKIIILLLTVFPLISFAQEHVKLDVVGTWEGKSKGEIGSFEFNKDGYAYFITKGQKMGGKEFDMDGVKGQMTYQFNFKTTPIEFDLVITKIDTKESQTSMGIVKFLDKDTMIVAMGFGKPRPTNFENKKDIIILHRKVKK